VSDQRRYRTIFNLTRDERTALEAVSIETRLPLVQVVKRLLSLPHTRLVALVTEPPEQESQGAPLVHVDGDPYKCLCIACLARCIDGEP